MFIFKRPTPRTVFDLLLCSPTFYDCIIQHYYYEPSIPLNHTRPTLHSRKTVVLVNSFTHHQRNRGTCDLYVSAKKARLQRRPPGCPFEPSQAPQAPEICLALLPLPSRRRVVHHSPC